MLSERISLLRKAHKMNQVDLAGVMGVSKQSVSNWENSNILPSVDMLKKLADYFHVSTDYLLGRDDRTYVEVTGLPVEKVAHLQQIIDDIQQK